MIQQTMIKRKFGVSTLVITMLAFGLLGCEKQQTMTAKTPEVRVATIASSNVLLTTEIAGRTAPYQIAEVRPQVSGIIQSRNFTEGSDVKAGQTLYLIDPSTYQAQYESAAAALESAHANLETLRLKAQRYAELVKIKAVSRQDAQDIQAAYKQAKAQVNMQWAAVKAAKIRLTYTKVNSPISGRIGISDVTAGALVTEHQGKALTTVQQLDPMYVNITQSSVDMLKLRRAIAEGRIKTDKNCAIVRLKLEDGTEYPLEGKLQFTDVTVDPSTGMVTLRALFPNPNNVLLPNMYVRAQLAEGINENAILAPVRAVSRDSKGNATVYVVTEKNTVQLVPVVTHRMVGNNWLIEQGLKAGDRVVIEGLQRIRPGSPVAVVEK